MTDDEMNRMPFTSDLMTPEEFQRWVASRKAAGAVINIATCELGWWGVNQHNPYGIPGYEERWPCNQECGIDPFVRSADSRGWINECDLPVEKYVALRERLDALDDREREIARKAHYYRES